MPITMTMKTSSSTSSSRIRPYSTKKASIVQVASLAAIVLHLSSKPSHSFQQPPPCFFVARTADHVPAATTRRTTTRQRRTTFFSSVGGGSGDGSPPPGGGDGSQGEWDDFLDPSKQESENLRRAREYAAENSLPISFELSEEDDDDDDDSIQGEGNDDTDVIKDADAESDDNTSALTRTTSNPGADLLSGADLDKKSLEKNPYMAVVSHLSPSELISKFTATAHPRVQNAVRSTILGLIGGLPKMAFDTTTYTTGQRLASLMFQLQMTGYMFKNAEYRLSVQSAIDPASSSDQFLLAGSDEDVESDKEKYLKGKVRGKLRIKIPSVGETDDGSGSSSSTADDDDDTSNSTSSSSNEMEVDAAAYMSELSSEVSILRDELMTTRREKEEALRKDLLLYIRTLPEKELRDLTNTMSQDVLVAMKGLVNAVISGIGEDQIGADTITEQSGEAMAQLCMWQLAIGYNLRTLEVREEMKKSLLSGVDDDTSSSSSSADGGGIDISDSEDAFE